MGRATRIVLVGLAGSGKSTVGQLVAQRLGWRFVDLDVEIERQSMRTIPEIFASDGEEGFRAWERSITNSLTDEKHLVLAPGGGWFVDPAHRAWCTADTLTVYLQVSPEVSLARMGDTQAARPLLGGADPMQRLREQLRQREALYMKANHTLSVDLLSPDQVATTIVMLASGGSSD